MFRHADVVCLCLVCIHHTSCQTELDHETQFLVRRILPSFLIILKMRLWDIVYEESTQVAFTWFQGVIDLFFDKCFQKRLFKNDISEPLSMDDQ